MIAMLPVMFWYLVVGVAMVVIMAVFMFTHPINAIEIPDDDEPVVCFSHLEAEALKVVIDYVATLKGEDTIGVLMLTGAFNKLPKGVGAVADLATKLESIG